MRPGQPRLHPRAGRRGGHGAETGRGIPFSSPFPPKSSFHRVSYIYFIQFVIIFPQREDLGLVFPSTVFFFPAEGVSGKGPPGSALRPRFLRAAPRPRPRSGAAKRKGLPGPPSLLTHLCLPTATRSPS